MFQNAAVLRSAVSTGSRDLALRGALVVGFAALTGVCANIAVPNPASPVPFTLQTFAVPLAAVTLGPVLGSASMALYLLMALVGLPVLGGGESGPAAVFGATGGYLLGFVLCQPVIGFVTRRLGRRAAGAEGQGYTGFWGLLGALMAAKVVLFATGLTVLGLTMGTGVARTLELGLWPYLPGDAIKTAMTLIAGVPLLALARRRGW